VSPAPPDTPPPYRTLVFDCDSTLSRIEGIDELGAAQRDAIAALTEQAMDGALRLEEVYGRRLALVRPSRARVAALGEQYVATLVGGARELVRAARALGKRVAIVSGGVRPAVEHLARALGLAPDDVHAVALSFDARGEYAGFDERSPLARSGGKAQVVRELGARPGARPLVLVGDGITDLEAAEGPAGSGGAERFVAYGGVVRRAPVFARARFHCDTPDFAGLVPLLFSPAEIDKLARDPDHAALFRAHRTDA